MRRQDVVIPLIFGGLLLLTSWVPLGQITLAYWNGALLVLLGGGPEFVGLGLVIQLLCTVGLLFLYAASKHVFSQLFFAVLIVFFVNGLTYLGGFTALEFVVGTQEEPPWFAWVPTAGALSTGAALYAAKALRHASGGGKEDKTHPNGHHAHTQ